MTTAIETLYKGYRFRSRLEARWAVFFDALGVDWQYEPQGYEVGGQRYLPDFWLHMLGWVEVKGSLNRAGLVKLATAAASDGLPLTPDGDRPVDLGAEHFARLANPVIHRLLVLGDIPEPWDGWGFSQIGLSNGVHVVHRTAYLWPLGPELIGVGNWSLLSADPPDELPHGTPLGFVQQNRQVAEALTAARSARFEHGQSGAAA
jgi:hypothetical protein